MDDYKNYINKMNRDTEEIKKIHEQIKKDQIDFENNRLIRNAELIANKWSA